MPPGPEQTQADIPSSGDFLKGWGNWLVAHSASITLLMLTVLIAGSMMLAARFCVPARSHKVATHVPPAARQTIKNAEEPREAASAPAGEELDMPQATISFFSSRDQGRDEAGGGK